LQKVEEVASAIVSCGVSHTIPRIQLAMNCQTFLDDPILLSVHSLVQSDLSFDAHWPFMDVLDGLERQFSPQVTNDLMSLARELGHNDLITSFITQQDIPCR
jgi:hypothetical protein